MTTNDDPNQPIPLGAVWAGDWEADPAGQTARLLRWSLCDDAAVALDGRQYDDGRVDVGVSICAEVYELDATQARALAAGLSAAADELDELAGHRWTRPHAQM